jgi:hypothetical protein
MLDAIDAQPLAQWCERIAKVFNRMMGRYEIVATLER